MSWWAYFLTHIARFVNRKCLEQPDRYRNDLSIIAVAELCHQHCLTGNKYDIYGNIVKLKQEDRHFFMDEFMKVLDQGFDRWATRICIPYKNVEAGKLNVYLCEGKKPHLISLFHIIYQSTRVHQVFTYY